MIKQNQSLKKKEINTMVKIKNHLIIEQLYLYSGILL